MDRRLYTLEMDMDWPLFGGQLLTVPDTPTADGGGGHVLQDWSHEPAGQLVSTSPSVEVLQDSIWPDITYGEESADFTGFWRKENVHPRGFDSRHSASDNGHFFFPNNDFSDIAADDSPSVSDGSFGVYDNNSPLSLSPIDEKFEYGNVFTGIATIPDFPNQKNQNLYQAASFSHSVDLQTFQHEPAYDSVPQEVPRRFYSDLDSFDCDSESLRDPENVCKILQQLDDGGSLDILSSLIRRPILSPVSPDEVESVLSGETASLEIFHAPVDDRSPIELPVLKTDDSAAVLAGDYLQRDVTLKAESSFSRSASPCDPYCVEPKGDRRLKKKEQNKTAALRYRRKKREEKGVVLTEVEELELKNAELKARAGDLTREINYLRGLLDEIEKQ